LKLYNQSNDQDTPGYFWSSTYAAIAQANQALDLLNNIKEIDDQEKYNAVKGEALTCKSI
jgi:ethanolamine utilization protein EutP (predicted NTPase)